MSWFDVWRGMVRPLEKDCRAHDSGTVRDEMMFHFRELVNEKVADGTSFDAAWEQAEQQFGSIKSYEDECHALRMEQRLAWRMSIAVIALILLALGGWSLTELRRARLTDDLRGIQNELAALRNEQNQVAAKAVQPIGEQIQPAGHDLTGQVLDFEERPLPDATILVILKTWPFGMYRQEDFTTTTDHSGRFLLPNLIPTSSQYAVQVAALKEGFAFHSFYQFTQRPSGKPDPITLQLEPASRVTFVVRDEKGVPIPNVNLIPFVRDARSGDKHQVYFQGSRPIQQTTDAEGRVQFGCFRTGDTAEIYVQLPGQDWGRRVFEVSNDDVIVDFASTAVVVN
jgi:hypothetical protein